ncbi:MAG: hypothetical protein US50_C0032G0008, partial [Candidatus Nomurabacteria bacterium GW2011_GWB1_37_5]
AGVIDVVGVGTVVGCEQSFGQFQSVSVPPQIPSPQTHGYPQSTEQELLLSVVWQILSPQVPHLMVVGCEQSFSQLVVVSPMMVSHLPSPQKYIVFGLMVVGVVEVCANPITGNIIKN